MLELVSALGLVLLFSGSAALGFFVRARVPEEHRSKEAIELIQLAMSLLVTFAAIVLGLLTTSVKTDYDTAEHDRVEFAAQLTQLDRCMRNYGPGSETVRSQLQAYTAAVIASTWPNEPHPRDLSYPDTSHMARVGANPVLADLINAVGTEIRKLDPVEPLRRTLASDCFNAYRDVLKGRWAVVEDVYSSMSAPFYGAALFWMTLVFAGLGLRAPPNRMVLIVIALCVLSVASAMAIILDMNMPYTGAFHISSSSMRTALAHMMEP